MLILAIVLSSLSSFYYHHNICTVLSDDKKVLTLNNVTKQNDILCVQCIVKNSVGQTMGDACLNVIGK